MKQLFNTKPRDINLLVNRFFAGETTVAEEARLFAAFAPGRRVPADLEQYRDMMQWYASLAPCDNAPRRRGIPRMAIWFSSAAAVVMMLSVGVSYMMRMSAQPDEYDIYLGSYVIRNGEKVTDLAQILPEVKRVESIVSSQQAVVERAVARAHEVETVGDYAGIDMDDPMVRDLVQRAFSE